MTSVPSPKTRVGSRVAQFMQLLMRHRVLEVIASAVGFSTVLYGGSLILQDSNLNSATYRQLNEVIDIKLVGATLIAMTVVLALTLFLRLRQQAQWPSLGLTLIYGFIGVQVLTDVSSGTEPANFGIYTFATLVCLIMTLLTVFGEDESRV